MSPRKAGEPKSSTDGKAIALRSTPTETSSKAQLPAKRPPGRPSKYSPQLVERMCEEIAKGMSVHRLCELDWTCSEKTFYDWLDQHPEFSQQYVRARERQADRMAAECLEIADDIESSLVAVPVKGGGEYLKADSAKVQQATLRVKARQWQMARMSPRRWGDRVVTEHEGNVVPQAVLIVRDSSSGAGAGPAPKAVTRQGYDGDCGSTRSLRRGGRAAAQ
jgi:hypothetical protein